jgi:NADH-dependent peroxiredoxin subunit C
MSESMTEMHVGQSVPDFEIDIYDSEKDDFGKIRFADLKSQGKWTILFFYPADFTFVWATEFAALAEQYDRFKKVGAEVITISTDTQYVHLAWRRHEKALSAVQYPMGADPTGKLARQFGVYDGEAGLALRGTFIISPQGTLLNSEVNFYNMGRNIDELMRKFKANLHLSRKPHEVCPSKWKDEGDKTLAPGPQMVGRVGEAMGS